MTTIPIEVLCEIVRLFLADKDQSPTALSTLSLAFPLAYDLVCEARFKTVTIATCYDCGVYQELAGIAAHLFQKTKTLRLVRMMGDEDDGFGNLIESGESNNLSFQLKTLILASE